MSILSDFEDRLEGAVEGMFGTLFRSPVQPAELARAASKEMTRSRKLGIDKTYVANVYFIFISGRDAETLGGLLTTLEGELETYLLAFSRERDFQLATRPVVRFATDERLRLGRFDVIGEQMSIAAIYEELGSVAGITDDLEAGPHSPAPPPKGAAQRQVQEPPSWGSTSTPAPGRAPGRAPTPTPEWAPASPPAPAVAPPPAPTPTPAAPPAAAPAPITAVIERAWVDVPGLGQRTLEPEVPLILGRQQDCGLFIEDANVSRQHAELAFDGRVWTLRDLGSTNGTHLNGRTIGQTPVALRDGDSLQLGVSELRFHQAGGRA
jgi:hypothetical protein